MADKFQNKYRIPSARLPGWDYGSNAAYFVTICTKNREYFFGDIVDSPSANPVETQCIASLREPQQQMQLSEIGKIAESEWLKTPQIRPDMNLKLGAFVIMPNHFHAIIIIGENKYNTPGTDAMHGVSANTDAIHGVSANTDAIHGVSANTDAIHGVSANTDAIHGVSANTDAMNGVSANTDAMHCVSTAEKQNAFAPQSKNLASIIRGYKSAVTKYATINHINFAWQPRFHDHIIRDNESFHRISQYIINNPLNWVNDEWHL